LIEALKAGGRIAVVSDAGMPGISDPEAGWPPRPSPPACRWFPFPRQCALSALVASGLPTGEFLFLGFCRRRPGQGVAGWKRCG